MNGLVLLNKPKGKTSFSAAAALRHIYKTKRVGHTGTLDPMATGVLPVLIGRATRLSSFILEADKRYTATVKFGITTDTLDITGNVLKTQECDINIDLLNSALSKFKGVISQVPPMFSAIKKDGVRLYELARKGEEIERTPREVTIKELNILYKKDKNEFVIDILCSKGTYIRSLADDLGKELGTGAVLTDLVRTSTAGFSLEDCVSLEELEKNPKGCLIPAEKVIPQFQSVFVSEKQKVRFLNGGELSLERLKYTESKYPFYKIFHNEHFLGLGEIDIESNSMKVKCIITE